MSVNLIFSRLEKQLRLGGFDTSRFAQDVASRDPSIFIKILHFVLVEHCPEFYASLVSEKYALFMMKDNKFIQTVFAMLVSSSGQKVRN